MRKKTQKEAEHNVLNKCIEKNYTLVESFIYDNNMTKLKLKCNKDGYIWESTYHAFIIQNTLCKKCTKKYRPTQKEVNDKISNKCIEKNYTLVEPFVYKNVKTKIHLKCNIDNNDWITSYGEFINNNSGCIVCFRKSKKTKIEVDNNILIRCKEMNYELVKPFVYKNNNSKIYLRCLKHENNFEWVVSYRGFILSDKNCPKCKNSKGEILITKFLQNNNIKYIDEYKFDDCKYKNKLSFDFYLPELKTCLEYDGKQHYKSIKHFGGEKRLIEQKIKDEIKNKYCKNNNIKLIRIPYTEYNNIEKILNEKIKGD